MPHLKIEVATTQVSESTPHLSVNVSSHFEHDLPVAGPETPAKDLLERMVNMHGPDQVYDLFCRQYVLEMRGPSRKVLIEQWNALPPETRQSLIVYPENGTGDDASAKRTATAKLPDEQQHELQVAMDAWRLGERAPRTVRTRPTEDLVDNISRRIASGDLQGEELEALRLRAAELLGLPVPRRR